MTNKPDYPHARIEYGEHLEVAPGVFWLRMPLPFSLDHINLWLLEDEGAWTLIDTGFNTKQTCLYWNDYFSDVNVPSSCHSMKFADDLSLAKCYPVHLGNAVILDDAAGT